MKASIYNIEFEHNSDLFLYNTLTTSIINIDEITKNNLFNNNLNLISEELIEILKENGFIVEDDFDEAKAYFYYYETTRYAGSLNKIDFIFIPTYFCNLACSYCIQDCNKENRIISQKNLDNFIKFAEREILKPNIKDVMLTFYGGEPLIAKEECIRLAEGIKKITDTKEIELQSYMVTNATLIDQDIIDRLLKPYNVYMQISIDGIPTTHDKKRYYKNKTGTFDKILKNIELLCVNELKNNITIRVNLDIENINQANDIVDIFKNKSNDIYFGLLTAQGNNKTNSQNCISSIDCAANYDYELSKTLLKNGFEIYGSKFGKKMPCADNSENKYMIDLYLDVYKCDLLLGNKKYRVGIINENADFLQYPQFYEQITRTPFTFKKCEKCILLPACAGGCAAKAVFKTDKFDTPFCELSKEELINYLKNYINLDD